MQSPRTQVLCKNIEIWSFSGPYQVILGHFQVFALFQVFSHHSGYLGIQVCDKPSSVLFPINVHGLPKRVI